MAEIERRQMEDIRFWVHSDFTRYPGWRAVSWLRYRVWHPYLCITCRRMRRDDDD